MSYPVNQKLNPNQQQQAMGYNTALTQPVSAETVRQNINTNPVVKSAKEENPVFLIGAMIPLWLGLSKGMDKFNAACRGTGKNLITTVRDFGDKVGEFFGKGKNGKLRTDSFFEWVGGKGKFINDKVIKKFTILDCLVNHPTKPESSMVKVVASGTLGELVQDAPTMFTKYSSLGAPGKYDLEKLKKLGFESVEHFEKWKQGDLLSNVDDVIARCRKMPAEEMVDFALSKDKSFLKRKLTGWGMAEASYDKSFGKVGKFLGRKIYFSEMANKLEALKGTSSVAGKTVTGKLFSKVFLRFAEGMTNATAGGKLAIAMQAFCFAQSIGATIDAPKGEKIKTFMEQLVYNLSFYLLMPLGIGLMHRANGLRYLGMTGEQIAKYRKDLKILNDGVTNGTISATEHEMRLKDLKLLGKGDTKINKAADGWGKTIIKGIKNIVYKPVRFLARNTLGIGLEGIKPFIEKNTGKFATFMKKLPSRLRFGAGYPVRFIGYLFLIAPPLAGVAVKLCSHSIFGKPTKSVLDDSEPKEQKPLPPLIYPPQEAEAAATGFATAAPSLESVMQAAQQNNMNYNSQNMVNPNQQSQKQFITTQAKAQETQRRYIPASDGVKVTMVDPKEAKARRILKDSEKSERIARKQMD